MLDKLGGLTGPHSEREGVHEGLRPPFTSTGAFIIHPKLCKVQGPKVSSCRHLESVCPHGGLHQSPRDVVELCVFFVGVPLEDGVQNGYRGRGAGERGERRREEGLSFEGLQKGLKVGAGAVGGVSGVGGYHFRCLYGDGARHVCSAGGILIRGNHQLMQSKNINRLQTKPF